MSPLLEISALVKHFPVASARAGGVARRLWGRSHAKSLLHAVDGVDFTIAKGESVGLVGESGCGKSTLARVVARLIDATAGDVRLNGRDIGMIPARLFASVPQRAWIQMVFQDPNDSLNPRFTAFDAIAEPLRLLGDARSRAEIERGVRQAVELVGLPSELLGRFPHQLSGGQKEIGRAH